MALFYLVRHGEAKYDSMLENGFWDLAGILLLYLKKESNRQK